jgi:hypothetical protein
VAQGGQEPTIPSQVSLETPAGGTWLSHAATIVDLSRHEVWIGIEEPLTEPMDPDGRVRLVLRHENGPTQTAETVVLRRIGGDGQVLALMRPTLWDPPTKRAHSRARLAIPVTLHPAVDAPPLPARTTNIGAGGVYCLTHARLAVGRRLPISIKLTPVKSFECGAEVVRVDEDTDDATGRRVVIALRLLELTEVDQATLAADLAALADDVDADYVPLAWRGVTFDEPAAEAAS